MLLTHSNMQLALAQSVNQTSSSSSSSSSSPASPPPPSPQAMQNTFYAKGVNGILVLDPNAIQGAPPPSKYFGTIVGGNWSLDVVNRSIQNFTMNLLSISPSGAISEAALSTEQQMRLLQQQEQEEEQMLQTQQPQPVILLITTI